MDWRIWIWIGACELQSCKLEAGKVSALQGTVMLPSLLVKLVRAAPSLNGHSATNTSYLVAIRAAIWASFRNSAENAK